MPNRDIREALDGEGCEPPPLDESFEEDNPRFEGEALHICWNSHYKTKRDKLETDFSLIVQIHHVQLPAFPIRIRRRKTWMRRIVHLHQHRLRAALTPRRGD